jgi:hypothetical protein
LGNGVSPFARPGRFDEAAFFFVLTGPVPHSSIE